MTDEQFKNGKKRYQKDKSALQMDTVVLLIKNNQLSLKARMMTYCLNFFSTNKRIFNAGTHTDGQL